MTRLTKQTARDLLKLPLAELSQMAHAYRCTKLKSDKPTYIVMRIVSYTNICVADCKYCAFYRRPGDAGGYVLSLEQIFEKVDELIQQGGSLVAMEGGFNPDLTIEHYENLVRHLRQRYGDTIEIYGPTAVEALFIARVSKLSLLEALTRLKDAGLRWIPGGGAEILTDEWRKKLSPKKYSVAQYFEVMREATRLGYGTTSTMVIGFGEDFEARLEHLEKLREHQDETNGFTSFLCWTYQNQNTALGGAVTSNEDYLRTLAISRLYLDNILHVRASFLTQGSLGPQALMSGADDFDIVLEDEVTQMAGTQLETKVEKVLQWVKDFGLEPEKRGVYSFIRLNK